MIPWCTLRCAVRASFPTWHTHTLSASEERETSLVMHSFPYTTRNSDRRSLIFQLSHLLTLLSFILFCSHLVHLLQSGIIIDKYLYVSQKIASYSIYRNFSTQTVGQKSLNGSLPYPLGAVYCILREVGSIDRRLLAHARHSPVLERFHLL